MKSTARTKTSITESPSNFDNLDKMSIEELLTNINEEDSKVHIAVKQALPQIKNLVEQIESRMKKGGRNKWQTWCPGCLRDSTYIWCS